MDSIYGHDILYAGANVAVIPESICADSISEANQRAASLKRAAEAVRTKSGLQPLIIPEDKWHHQREMIRSRILSHLNIFTQIYARNCEVRKIDKSTAAGFLDANHSYGNAACRYRYGLFLKRHTGHNAGSADIETGTLVAVATFSNARKWIKGDKIVRSYEWTRYASLPEVRLSGGMGKLLNAFIDEVKPDDIMSYADLEWSEGKVYETLGFELEGQKGPVNFCVDTSAWTRHALRPDYRLPSTAALKFHTNLGSNKYRMKLTDYH